MLSETKIKSPFHLLLATIFFDLSRSPRKLNKFPLANPCISAILTLPERRVCGLFIEAEKKQSTNNLTFNLRCHGSACLGEALAKTGW